MWKTAGTLIASLLWAGCASRGAPLHPVLASADHGEEIYRGAVFVPEGAQAFRYARFSDRATSTWTSTHVSHEAGSNALVVVQTASHDAAYALEGFRESYVRRGVEASGGALPDGGMRFVVQRAGRTKVRTEAAGAPYVVGPTLFGFARSRWDTLLGGDAVDVRFVVAERGRSYAFTLKLESTTSERTVIVMTAKRAVVRATVAPMRLVFDTSTRNIVRYEGRIPPVHEGRPLDAVVRYEHLSARFF